MTAADDDLTDSPETLNVTLSNATAVNGTATAADSEAVTITDVDQDITITIADTQTSISEEAGGTDTFTITLSQAINTGNTVTVDVDFATGTTTEDADFVTAAQAALQAVADATAGVSFDGTTLTFDDTFVGTTLSFGVTAADDDLTDSPETLTVTLSNATAVNGTATAADSEAVTVTDNDDDEANNFDGAQLTYQYLYPGIGTPYAAALTFTTGNGVEVDPTPDVDFNDPSHYAFNFNVDVSAKSILITYVGGVLWSDLDFNGFKITDVDGNVTAITGVSDNSLKATTSFDADNIFVNWQGQSFAADDTIVISVTFSNNIAADITGDISGTVDENAVPNTAAGNLTATDPDNPTFFQPVAAGTATAMGYGTYELTAAGEWTFSLNNAHPEVDALNEASAPLIDSFTVFSADGTSQVVEVTITGTNDAPIAVIDDGFNAVPDVFNASAGDVVTGNLFANDFDPDAGDTLTNPYTWTFTTENGNIVTIDANGTFELISASNFIGTERFHYLVQN